MHTGWGVDVLKFRNPDHTVIMSHAARADATNVELTTHSLCDNIINGVSTASPIHAALWLFTTESASKPDWDGFWRSR